MHAPFSSDTSSVSYFVVSKTSACMCNGNIFKDCFVMSKLGSQWCYDGLEQLKVQVNILEARLEFTVSQWHYSVYHAVALSAV